MNQNLPFQAQTLERKSQMTTYKSSTIKNIKAHCLLQITTIICTLHTPKEALQTCT